MSNDEIIGKLKKQRKVVQDLEESLNVDYRYHQGSHHTVMLVMLTVITFVGGALIHLYVGVVGAVGLAAYSYYLLYLGRSIEKKQKKLQLEEQKIMELDKQINEYIDKDSTYA